jgi:excisionase family DNA binding protein
MEQAMAKEYTTIDEIAEKFHVSVSTVRRWIRSSKLVGQKAGSQWRFDPAQVRDAFDRGLLSGGAAPRDGESTEARAGGSRLPEWAVFMVAAWRRALDSYLGEVRPEHVVANDRRGAKVWALMGVPAYPWGTRLWHSAAIRTMEPADLRRLFRGRVVLLFDEMMQHGREMHDLRQLLAKAGAKVSSFVCVTRKSHLESGELIENTARAGETLDDSDFVHRATSISRLMTLCIPPLDVGHIVIRGAVGAGVTGEQLIERLANWGSAFIVMHPDEGQEELFLAVTLDRPQFLDTRSDLPTICGDLQLRWTGPCKVRLYINTRTQECFISFIVYPHVVGRADAWDAVLRGKRAVGGPGELGIQASSLLDGSLAPLTRGYEAICTQLAIKMAKEFVSSGVAEDVGISLSNTTEAVDLPQLQATFGPSRGKEIEKQVRAILSKPRKLPFQRHAVSPPALFVVAQADAAPRSHNAFACRGELLQLVGRKEVERTALSDSQPTTYEVLCRKLSRFSESTIGRVLDYELDWGTVKPACHAEAVDARTICVGRVFYRGEYNPWSEMDAGSIPAHGDDIIQKTIVIGPHVLEQFLRRMGWASVGATHLAKLFANLRHDWRGQLYYFLRPYKYGPLPYVPQVLAQGQYLRYERFLLNVGCLAETSESGRGRTSPAYRPADQSRLPWRDAYERITDGSTKAHIGALIRLYAAIQANCNTERPSGPHSRQVALLRDPLVVLATARNRSTAYTCAWFEVDDWRTKGRLLFSRIGLIAMADQHNGSGSLAPELSAWAEPAALLFQKLEMYRHLPFLRKQIEELRDSGDHEIAHVVLETVDPKPLIETDSDCPIGNLVWACQVMRSFTSFTRQILTACHLDVDKRDPADRTDEHGVTKDATFYLNRLLVATPETAPLTPELRECVEESGRATLTPQIADALHRAFRFVLNSLETGKRIPIPPKLQEDRARMENHADLIARLRDISLGTGYAVAVSDIKNFVGIASLYPDGIDSFEALAFLQSKVEACAEETVGVHQGVRYYGVSADSLVFAGADADQVLGALLDLTKRTTLSVNQAVREVADLGLLRSGMAWCDGSLGKAYEGVRPGITAYRIGDRHGRQLGDVAVTRAVFERLSPENRRAFQESVDEEGKAETTEQGAVSIRHWKHGVDGS